jgi:hypothetical protein
MDRILLRGGQVAGVVGMLLIAVSFVARLAGKFTLGPLATGTLLLAGVAAVVVGCFLLLWLLADNRKQ